MSVVLRWPLLGAACLATFAACGAVSLSPLTPEADAAAKCRPPGAKVIARSARIVVSKRRDRVTQACYLQTRRVRNLDYMPRDALEDSPTVAFVGAVNDRYVAYGSLISTMREGSAFRLIVLDARRMRIATNVELYSGSRQFLPTVGRLEPDAVLAENGAVAWIARLPAPSSTFELRYAGRGAKASTLIAASPGIEVGSLALGKRYVYWRQDGVTGSFAIGS